MYSKLIIDLLNLCFMNNNYIFKVQPDQITKTFQLIDNNNNRIIEWEEGNFEKTNKFGRIDINFEKSFCDKEEEDYFNNGVKKEMMEYIKENNLYML